jgi:hypothetical protein
LLTSFLLEHGDESEKLRPEELNQQTIEALVAESNLVLLKTAYTILLLPLYRIFLRNFTEYILVDLVLTGYLYPCKSKDLFFSVLSLMRIIEMFWFDPVDDFQDLFFCHCNIYLKQQNTLLCL